MDVVNKIVNFVLCNVGFIIKCFDGKLFVYFVEFELYVEFVGVVDCIVELFEVCEFGCVICEIIVLVDKVN